MLIAVCWALLVTPMSVVSFIVPTAKAIDFRLGVRRRTLMAQAAVAQLPSKSMRGKRLATAQARQHVPRAPDLTSSPVDVSLSRTACAHSTCCVHAVDRTDTFSLMGEAGKIYPCACLTDYRSPRV